MKKAAGRFVLNAMIAVAVLLVVLLSVINITGFAMAADDADRLTMQIAKARGRLDENPGPPAVPSGLERLGPQSPELAHSTRYFAYSIEKKQMLAHNISAFSPEEAADLAENISGGKTGWVKLSYRYRVYRKGGQTTVVVVDQGRELIAPYRILVISVVGGLVCLAVSFVFLTAVAKKLFRPLEEADRRQKQFFAAVESDIRVPLTVISADTALIERENGESSHTDSIRRQTGKISALLKKLGDMPVFDAEGGETDDVNLTELLLVRTDEMREEFEKKGIGLSVDAGSGATVRGDISLVSGMIGELVKNALKFSEDFASFTVLEGGGHVTLRCSNGTSLGNRQADNVFDRFVRLENAGNADGRGTGLSFVREVVAGMNGRASAFVKDGVFTVELIF